MHKQSFLNLLTQTKGLPHDKGLLRHFMAVEGWGRGGGQEACTVDSLARSVCDS